MGLGLISKRHHRPALAAAAAADADTATDARCGYTFKISVQIDKPFVECTWNQIQYILFASSPNKL